MKSFIELLNEEKSQGIFEVSVLGNFYAGKFYEWGLDKIFVLASSPDEALKLAKRNIDEITLMFKNKKFRNGKKALQKRDHKKIEIPQTPPKKTTMTKLKKVLTQNNKFEEVDLSEL